MAKKSETLISHNKIVFQKANDLIIENSKSLDQKELLDYFLKGIEKKFIDQVIPMVSLPLAVYEDLGGDINEAIGLALASLFLYLAVDIADDISDNDFIRHWGYKYSASEGFLASLIFSSSFAPFAIDTLNTSEKKINLLKKTISRTIIRMAAGQQGDLNAMTSYKSITSDEIIKNVTGKSGEELACFALMPAQLYGSCENIEYNCESIGRYIGIAAQLSSDCRELFSLTNCIDLENGTLTLPIAIYLETLNNHEKEKFYNLLTSAKNDENAREEVRLIIQESGSLLKTLQIIRSYRVKARTCADKIISKPNNNIKY